MRSMIPYKCSLKLRMLGLVTDILAIRESDMLFKMHFRSLQLSQIFMNSMKEVFILTFTDIGLEEDCFYTQTYL